MLYILDEPTTGLHFDDIAKLLAAFKKLLQAGHSLLVIEHNLDVIKTADWIIDLGPEGGEEGGHLVTVGTPEQVAQGRRVAHRPLPRRRPRHRPLERLRQLRRRPDLQAPGPEGPGVQESLVEKSELCPPFRSHCVCIGRLHSSQCA